MKRILFQGDSITDADRSREKDYKLGCGYPQDEQLFALSVRYRRLQVLHKNTSLPGSRLRQEAHSGIVINARSHFCSFPLIFSVKNINHGDLPHQSASPLYIFLPISTIK